jgi:hypothetical protein
VRILLAAKEFSNALPEARVVGLQGVVCGEAKGYPERVQRKARDTVSTAGEQAPQP